MKNDPYMTTAKFGSTCPETGLQIKKGEEIAYYPRDRRAFHRTSKAADNVRNLQFNAQYGMADANW